MRPLEALLDPSERGWQLVEEWIASATREVEVLPGAAEAGAKCLSLLQVTTASPMGALAYRTGGLLVDGGWVRVLGGGCARLGRSIASWNGRGEERERLPGALLVADDPIGGFFAINGGRFPGRPGSMHYFAPDSLAWEDMDCSFSDWLTWLFTCDLEKFYETSRWSSWRADVAALPGDRGILVFPFPSVEGPAFEERTRGDVPIDELWTLFAD